MPYVDKELRRKLEDERVVPSTAGELTYRLFMLALAAENRPYRADAVAQVATVEQAILNQVKEYVQHNGVRYQTICEAMGSLECTSRELRRRKVRVEVNFRYLQGLFYREVAGPYEDQKIQQNGDVTL